MFCAKLTPEPYTQLALSYGLIATRVNIKTQPLVFFILLAIMSFKSGRASSLAQASSDQSNIVVTCSDGGFSNLTYDKPLEFTDGKI